MTNNHYLHWLQSWLQKLAASSDFRVLEMKKPARGAGWLGGRPGARTPNPLIKSCPLQQSAFGSSNSRRSAALRS